MHRPCVLTGYLPTVSAPPAFLISPSLGKRRYTSRRNNNLGTEYPTNMDGGICSHLDHQASHPTRKWDVLTCWLLINGGQRASSIIEWGKEFHKTRKEGWRPPNVMSFLLSQTVSCFGCFPINTGRLLVQLEAFCLVSHQVVGLVTHWNSLMSWLIRYLYQCLPPWAVTEYHRLGD